MTTPDRQGLDIEAILDDLYANEINASILVGLGWRLPCSARQSDDRRGFIAANHPRRRPLASGRCVQAPPEQRLRPEIRRLRLNLTFRSLRREKLFVGGI
jgi:hypothetical protein